MDENYGDIYIQAGEPVYLTQPNVALELRGNLEPLSGSELEKLGVIATRILLQQQGLSVISTFSLVCHYLVPFYAGSLGEGSDRERALISENVLVDVAFSLLKYLFVNPKHGKWEGGSNINDKDNILKMLRNNMDVHKNIMKKIEEPSGTYYKLKICDEGEFGVKATHLMLQYYANQSIHALVRPALVWIAAVESSETRVNRLYPFAHLRGENCKIYADGDRDAIYSRFRRLIGLFSHEFIFDIDAIEQDFNEGISLLQKCGMMDFYEGSLRILENPLEPICKIIQTCLIQFCNTYLQILLAAKQELITDEQAIFAFAKNSLARELESTSTDSFSSSLSSDAIKNGIKALTKAGALQAVSDGGASKRLLLPRDDEVDALMTALTSRPLTPVLRARL